MAAVFAELVGVASISWSVTLRSKRGQSVSALRYLFDNPAGTYEGLAGLEDALLPIKARHLQKLQKLSYFASIRKFMSTLVEQVLAAGLGKSVFTERQLSEILGGGDARRYGLVNRALEDGSLLRLKRGLYYLKSSNTGDSIHPFARPAAAAIPSR